MTQACNTGIQGVTHTETHTVSAWHAIKYMQRRQRITGRSSTFKKKKKKNQGGEHSEQHFALYILHADEVLLLQHNHGSVTQPQLLIF